MDAHTHRRPLDAYENIIEHLRKRHIHITETRKAIIAYIINSHEHPSTNKIYRDLLPEHPNMSLATIYNNMRILVDEESVTGLRVTNGTATYYDLMRHQHINIVYKNCGEIAGSMDVDATGIGKETYERADYQIARIQLTTYGIRLKCQKKLKAAGESFMTYYEGK